MKTRLMTILAFIGIVSVSCEDNVNEGTVWDDPNFIRVTAVAQPMLANGEEKEVKWAENDSLFVFDGEYKPVKLLTNDPSANIFFSYDWPGGEPTYAITPDIAGVTVTPEAISGIKVNPVQSISALNTYAPMTFVGKVSGNRTAYRLNPMTNLMSQVKIGMSDSTATSIVVEAPGGESVAGTLNVDMLKLTEGSSDFLTIADDDSKSTSVTIVPAEGTDAMSENGCLAKGSYYLTVIPQTYSQGLRITVNKKEGDPIVRNFRNDDGSLVVARSASSEFPGNLDEAELPETFAITLTFSGNNWPFKEPIVASADQNLSTGEKYTYVYEFEVDGTPFTREFTFLFYGNKKNYGLNASGYTSGAMNARITLPAIPDRYLKSVKMDVTNGEAYKKPFSIVTLDWKEIAVAPGAYVGNPSELVFPYTDGSTTVSTEPNKSYFFRFKSASTTVKSITIVYSKNL